MILGLSGGVDSLVSALLLKEQGYEVIACSFKLYRNDKSIEKARQLADKVGIAFYIIDLSKKFKLEIIDRYVSDYLNAETPNPCVWCNNDIKIAALYDQMKRHDASFFATGHYIRIENLNNRFMIRKGVDANKDQSYFLWNVKQDYLKFWKTPLGSFTKREVRQKAIDEKMGFLAHSNESMGVCFIDKFGYRNFIDKHPLAEHKKTLGEIIDIEGKILGKHQGLWNYTIGQKKGLNIESTADNCVVKLDRKFNHVIVGTSEVLFVKAIDVIDYYFHQDISIYSGSINVVVRGIGQNPKGNAEIKIIDNAMLRINLEDKAWAVASGQPVAFYYQDWLIGGGYVK